MKTGVATLIKSDLDNFNGTAHLYGLNPPLKNEPWDDEKPTAYNHVVVSGAHAMCSGPETYIFGADAEGNIVDWGELPGSFKGAIDHEEALRGAGYEVAPC